MSAVQTLMPVTFQKHNICLAGAVQYCLIVLVMKGYVQPVEEAVILWALCRRHRSEFRAGYLISIVIAAAHVFPQHLKGSVIVFDYYSYSLQLQTPYLIFIL
jgi:hypothetical protein